MYKVSIIIPAFNEADNIPFLINNIYSIGYHFPFEVIIINDGSTDDTLLYSLMESTIHTNLHVYSHRKNMGVTECLKTGVKYSTGDIIVKLDADNQYDPVDVGKLYKECLTHDLCVGRRTGYYKKKLVSKLYNFAVRKFFGVNLRSSNAIIAFKKDVFNLITLQKDWHRFLAPLLISKGCSYSEVDVIVFPRLRGKAKYNSIWRIPIGFLDLISAKLQTTIAEKPMLYFGYAGLLSLFASLCTVGYSLYSKIITSHWNRGHALLVILLLGVGMGSFIFGYLAEQIAMIREELKSEDVSLRK